MAPETMDLRTSAAARLLLLFEQGSPRHDDVPAAFRVLDNPEQVDAVRRAWPFGPMDVDLRKRTEGPLAGRCGPRSHP
jgi:hypothetical protein